MNTKTLLATASVFTLALAATSFTATPAMASECLLDTNNNGVPDSGDDDGQANSGSNNNNLACGKNAAATGLESVAIGTNTSATGAGSTVVGHLANASGSGSTVVGQRSSTGSATNATVVGSASQATGNASSAFGVSTFATGLRRKSKIIFLMPSSNLFRTQPAWIMSSSVSSRRLKRSNLS